MGLKCLRRRHSVRATSTTTVTTTTSATTTSSYLDVALVFPSPTPLSSFNISPSLPPPSHSLSLSLLFSRGVLVSALSLQSSSPSRSSYSTVCQLASTPLDALRSIRYSRLSSSQLPFTTFSSTQLLYSQLTVLLSDSICALDSSWRSTSICKHFYSLSFMYIISILFARVARPR